MRTRVETDLCRSEEAKSVWPKYNKNRGTLNFRPDYHNCASYEGMLWELDKEIIQKIDKNSPERMIDLIIQPIFLLFILIINYYKPK